MIPALPRGHKEPAARPGHARSEDSPMRSVAPLLSVLAAVGFAAPAGAQVLYGATASGGPGELYVLNPATGAVIRDVGPLNDISGANYPITGLAVHPVTGLLYGS